MATKDAGSWCGSRLYTRMYHITMASGEMSRYPEKMPWHLGKDAIFIMMLWQCVKTRTYVFIYKKNVYPRCGGMMWIQNIHPLVLRCHGKCKNLCARFLVDESVYQRREKSCGFKELM